MILRLELFRNRHHKAVAFIKGTRGLSTLGSSQKFSDLKLEVCLKSKQKITTLLATTDKKWVLSGRASISQQLSEGMG